MKTSISTISTLWFGNQTKTWSNFSEEERKVFSACQEVDRTFSPPSKVSHVQYYRNSDKTAFAKEVQKLLK